LTDLKSYDVGTKRDFDTSGTFVTPTLIELWRTAPYLHDGSAPTVMDVLTTGNRGNKHGFTSNLSKEELEDLAEFLLSL
jgi:cytochrome c peroxidase